MQPAEWVDTQPHADAALPGPPASAAPHLLDATMFWGDSGGVKRVVTTKQALLRAQGWRTTLLAPGVAGQGPHTLDCGGVPIPRSGGYRLVLRRGPAERLIEHAAPDIVEAADPYVLAGAVLRASSRLGIPAVAFCHSHLPAMAARLVGGVDGLATPHGRWAARRARAYLVRLYGRFDLVLAPSAGLAQQLRGWGVPRVVHQPLGVDCGVFRPEARDDAWRRTLQQRLGLADGTRLLVYTGRFAPEKNLPLLAAAVQRLGPGHALVAVGAGPMPPQGPGVHVLAPERDSHRLARLVASADAYVHAGDQETFGLGVLEAMACGTPVVASAAAGSGELVHEVGCAVQRRRPEEWADAVAATLQTGRGVASRAALARARAHDWTTLTARLARRYRRLMQAHADARAHGPHTAPDTLPAPEVPLAAQP